VRLWQLLVCGDHSFHWVVRQVVGYMESVHQVNERPIANYYTIYSGLPA
jgi:hypothetical protein